MSSPATSPAYRASLALNNQSITMMQRGDYISAIKTLSDSMALLKLVFSPMDGATSPPCPPKIQARLANERLLVAAQCLAGSSCTVNDKKDSDVSMTDCSRNGRNIQVNALDDEDFAHIREAAMHVPSSETIVAFAVRVRESHFFQDHEQSEAQRRHIEAERKFGIILFNHGLAHFLHHLSSASYCSDGALSLSRSCRSLTLAHLAHTRFTNHTPQEQQHCSQEDPYNTAENFPSLLLSALALNHLSQVWSVQNEIPRSKEARQAATGLCSMVDEDFFASYFSSQTNRVAAAA